MGHRLSFPLILAFASWSVSASEISSSPYTGEESREIKALSDGEVKELLEGKGMGYAKAAELNGYPGPAHVLELGEALGLSAGQRAQTLDIFEEMQSQARALGESLVRAEADLDGLFRSREITQASLADRLREIGTLQGELRNAHLMAHLEQTRLLTQEQVGEYMRLRGYGRAPDGKPHQHHY